MVKKQFFQEPTSAEILKYDSIREISEDLINQILNLGSRDSAILRRGLVLEEFSEPKKFLKHGREVKVPRTNSLTYALSTRKTPVQLREIAFDRIMDNRPRSGYTIRPFVGGDKTLRKFHLCENIEGSKLVKYCNSDISFKPRVEITPYDDVTGVEKDGASISVKVPSRTRGRGNYEIKFESVPIIDGPEKWGIAYNLISRHDCKSKFFNIRYKHKDKQDLSRVENFCAHDFVAYMAIIDHYYNNKKNIIPLQMNQFAIPTQFAVDFYNKLDRNCLIQPKEEELPRKLNRAEKEILLWGLVGKFGHDKTFYARDKLRAYDWGK